MTDMEVLFKTLDELSPEELKRLFKYLELKNKEVTEQEWGNVRRQRIPDLHAHLGEAWMSEDFNDPLPDEFWFGEE